jgi:hypothetical protein
MKIRKYILINTDIQLKREVQNINILELLILYNIDNLINHFINGTIDNILKDKWLVIYYIILDNNYVLSFDSNEYDSTYIYLKTLNRNIKIDLLLN